MFIKLKSDAGGHKAGAVIEIPDEAVARGYIASGLAEESDQSGLVASLVEARLGAINESVASTLDEFKRTFLDKTPSNGPPAAPDKGVEFDGEIEGTESPSDRGVDGKNVSRGLGEILQLIARTSIHQPQADREHADERLVRHFELPKVKNSEGVVSRTGTESMSGGATYGYFIKPEILSGYFEIAMEDSLIEPYAFNVPVGTTNEVNWPALDQYFTPTAGQSAATAGVQVYRKSEIRQRQASDAKLRNITLKINDLTAFTSVSRDLVADNYIAITTLLPSLFMKAMAFTKDYEFLNAQGGDRPIGLRNSAALLTVNRGTASHIYFPDLLKMLSIFDQSRLKSAMWIAHQSTYTELAAIKDSSGTFAFQPNALITQAAMFSAISGTKSGGMNFAAQGTLHGLPIRFTSDKLEILGTAGDLMLIDPSQYGVANRSGIEVGVSDQFLFDQDQLCYKWKLRNDGQSLWSGPRLSTTPAGGLFKTSPFVTLV
jgi:HK97 family phage major capsid protein